MTEVYRSTEKTGKGEATLIHERICRGLELFASKSEEITVEGNVYSVPSSTGANTYTVRLYEARESCNCPDFQHQNLGLCKHTVAALVHRAKGQERVVESVVHYYEPKPFQSRFLGFDCGEWIHELRTNEISPSGYVRVSTRSLTGEVRTRDVHRESWLAGLPGHRIVGEEVA